MLEGEGAIPQDDLLLYIRRASRTQVNSCLIVAGLLFCAFLIILPYAARPLPHFASFIPALNSALLFCDAVTATFLLSQAFILRSHALVVLALGYVFAGLIIVAHALTFPGALAPWGLLNADLNTAAWLYFWWHCGLPIAAIVYAILRRSTDNDVTDRSVAKLFAGGLAGVVIAASLLTLLSARADMLLPVIMTDAVVWLGFNLLVLASIVVVLLVTAMVMVWRGERSLLDIWLMVALWAWLLDAFLLVAGTARYSVGWYAGRVVGLLGSILVLLALLIKSSRLYLQLALSTAAEQRRREEQLMSLDAVAAAIAHEVKQPIAAMATQAAAALIRIRRSDPDLPKIEQTLETIVDDGHRAADVVGSIRALFGVRNEPTIAVDVNRLIREALELLSVALAGRRIAVTLDLDPDLPPLLIQRQQMQQVVLNLVTNAIEATEDVVSPRRVSIKSARVEDGSVQITVANTGNSIPPELADRVFDAFYTTKTHGTGMGLPLCRSIVETHGGTIWAEAGLADGAAFHVRLPPECS